MNKNQLVEYIAENSEGKLTKKQSEQAVDLYADALETAIKNGEKVQLVGVFTIEPVGRAARKGHNPQDGTEIEIAAKVGVKLKPGKRLEDAAAPLEVAKFLKKKK